MNRRCIKKQTSKLRGEHCSGVRNHICSILLAATYMVTGKRSKGTYLKTRIHIEIIFHNDVVSLNCSGWTAAQIWFLTFLWQEKLVRLFLVSPLTRSVMSEENCAEQWNMGLKVPKLSLNKPCIHERLAQQWSGTNRHHERSRIEDAGTASERCPSARCRWLEQSPKASLKNIVITLCRDFFWSLENCGWRQVSVAYFAVKSGTLQD